MTLGNFMPELRLLRRLQEMATLGEWQFAARRPKLAAHRGIHRGKTKFPCHRANESVSHFGAAMPESLKKRKSKRSTAEIFFVTPINTFQGLVAPISFITICYQPRE